MGNPWTGRAVRTGLPVLVLGLVTALWLTRDPRNHVQGTGALSVSVERGGISITAPKMTPWWGSFGTFVLCANDADDKITVKDVRYDVDPKPLDIRTWFREVPGPEERAGPADDWGMFFTQMGRHGAGYADGTVYRGTYSHELADPITLSCADFHDKGLGQPYVEIVTEVEVGSEGAWIRRTFVDYEVNGDEHTLEVPYDHVACGAGITEDWC